MEYRHVSTQEGTLLRGFSPARQGGSLPKRPYLKGFRPPFRRVFRSQEELVSLRGKIRTACLDFPPLACARPLGTRCKFSELGWRELFVVVLPGKQHSLLRSGPILNSYRRDHWHPRDCREWSSVQGEQNEDKQMQKRRVAT